MEDQSSWDCNGGCSFEVTTGYQDNGFRILARENNYNGLRQEIDGATLNHSSYIGKVFLKAEGDQDQTFEMMVNWRLKAGGNTYRKLETKNSSDVRI